MRQCFICIAFTTSHVPQPLCNNTLDNNNCPNAEASHEQRETWIRVYASSIVDRLNAAAIGQYITLFASYLRPSSCVGLQENITAIDAFYLMMMCPLDTLYRKKYSSFCKMFSKPEWEGFEYAMDLEQYYKTGRVDITADHVRRP